jgi:hypothetical protein
MESEPAPVKWNGGRRDPCGWIGAYLGGKLKKFRKITGRISRGRTGRLAKSDGFTNRNTIGKLILFADPTALLEGPGPKRMH